MKMVLAVLAVVLAGAACGDSSGGASTSTTVLSPPPTSAVTLPPATPPVTTVPAPTATATTAIVVDRGDVPDLFDVATITVAGEPWLVAVADTGAERQRGLMFVTDLGELDGMLFVFEADATGGFWMKDTLIPLEVAFFTAAGELVGVRAMVPCEADPCPTYAPGGAYRFALEAVPGPLGRLAADAELVVGSG